VIPAWGHTYRTNDIKKVWKKLCSARLMDFIRVHKKRPDGRSTETVRPITMEQKYLPGPHGSSLFTRGDTQTFATCTLGDSSAQQRSDSIMGMQRNRFMLQYFFPAFCVNDVKRMMKGRREVGHGNLAERSLMPAAPEKNDFPYTMRVESEVFLMSQKPLFLKDPK
jgi:polyribonucleotide nucleotidyltransferase